MSTPLRALAACLLLLAIPAVHAQYKQPPEPLLGVMRTPLPPVPRLDPTGKTLLLIQRAQYPGIERVAEPYLKLAGVRIEPRAHTRHDTSSGYGIRTCLAGFTLVDIASHRQTAVALPAGTCPDAPVWSPDGSRFAFANTTADRVELWVVDAHDGKARRVDGVQLNPILESTYQWLGDRGELLVKTVPAQLGPAPQRSVVPAGPEIKETTSGGNESSTYEARDTLGSPEDEAQFDWYATSQLAVVDTATDAVKPVGAPAVIGNVDAAPDGQHVMLDVLKRPYSYVVTWERFAHDVRVLDLASGKDKLIASLPAADNVPVRGVPTGPRDYQWRQNEPAALVFAEALDGGDWKHTVPARDKLMMWRAPFAGSPMEVTRTTQRFAGLSWFEHGSQALLDEYDANRAWRRTSLVDVDKPRAAGKVLWDLSTDDEYADPGQPLMRRLRNGAVVLDEQDGALFLRGIGASPAGERPFLDRYTLADGSTQRWFRSARDGWEYSLGFAGDHSRLLTWHESPTSPPNVWLRSLGGPVAHAAAGEAAFASSTTPITEFPDPAPLVRQIKKRLVKYQRNDGVELSFTLYTPPGYVEGTRVPAILYAYPMDYADPSKAGQVRGSEEQTFTILQKYRLLLLAGYAIIDNAAFPIVGDPKNAYDTYLQQLVADADAAVTAAVATGVVDRERIGVTGHSHGALMTANLLAHTNLFRAGVASSGGYNKTLTPFGFQNERRSFWKAPKVYADASAFFHADQIKAPILIVHGQDDANPGTEPTQSPRLFQAVRGLGGTAKLVMLPYEPHWYAARESNEHFVAEMLDWFDRYVKDAKPRAETAAARPDTRAGSTADEG